MTDGPILASFYSDSKKPPSRAARWGKHVAKRLGRVGDGPSPVEFSHWGGFAEYVTKEEMAAHAASLRRNVNWLEGGTIPFPCVTLLAKTD
jgi:hypothetical protein